MEQQPKKIPCCTALLAHVDAGKTTLSEALLYVSGARRTLGRVDHRDAYLDTHDLERARGITIFSKQARLETQSRQIVLVDTPGHVDFSGETERTLWALDCAVLVISGTDGVQAHTMTLWHLLERYRVPTFLFVSKMDLAGADREARMEELHRQLSQNCVDFGLPWQQVQEQAALCDEQVLEGYLESGEVSQTDLARLIAQRKLFPCCFGSGLKLDGVQELLDLLQRYGPETAPSPDFAARVYKITRDPQGARLTWMKLTGGTLKVRSLLSCQNGRGENREEKVVQLRLYSGEKFTAPETVEAGQLVAVTGLTETFAGQALGAEVQAQAPALEPVMTYRVNLPAGTDPAAVLPKLRLLEEEEPLLRLLWEKGQIHAQIMGRVQLEVFRALVRQRFGLDVTLDDRRISYKETIAAPVEGVGHYEPLRHYAECHLLLEPLPQGSGLVLDTACPTDVLDVSYQRLILTHLEEKVHRGVLTGGPITDMKITLLVGKAHLKHTEGGDFRQATYRALRQGLMEAESVLLEPWYDFTITLPMEQLGRAITDIRAMSGSFEPPQTIGDQAQLRGQVPAAELKDYADTLAAYTQGRGRIALSLHGYGPCHNTQAVVAELGYDPEGDLENTPDSVFCAHGAGFTVKWNQVKDYMHLDSGLRQEKPPEILQRNLRIEDQELEKIMEREFGPMTTRLYRPARSKPATEEITIRPPKERYILVDGYNIIFAWEDLAAQAKTDLDAARRQLCDRLASYAGFTGIHIVVVFDGYKQPGNEGEKRRIHNIQLVYTPEGQTADSYLETLAHEIGSNYSVRVASSDGLVQLSSFRSGVLRMSAQELRQEVDRVEKQMTEHFSK